MLKPQQMSKVIIAGAKSELDTTIEILHNLKLCHIEDYAHDHEAFRIGRPLEKGTKISSDLIAVRSISKNLELDKDAATKGKIKRVMSEQIKKLIPSEILPLQKKILNVLERRTALERRRTDRQNVRRLLCRLAAFPLPLELYSGYNSLDIFVGTVKADIRGGLAKITTDHELFVQGIERGEFLIALFISKRYSKAATELLNAKGFTPLEVPLMRGNVTEQITKIDSDIARINADMEKLDKILDDMKTRYRTAILAGEEYLTNEVQKTDAPLRFATSKNSFVIEGWIPRSKVDVVKLNLSSASARGLYIEVFEEKEYMNDGSKDPPIQLENPQGAKPYEYLIELFSLPSYKEFDPTMVLFLIFPIFFGFMIGDVGYGAVLMILALVMVKVFPSEDARKIARIVFIGGIFTILFGLLIFADAFGIPFHAHESGELNWSDALGVEIPIHSVIYKLGTSGVIEMLVLSVFAAFIHLGLGFLIGVSNEIHHNKKHAVAKAGWFVVLLGFFMLLMNMAKGTVTGKWIGNYLLFNTHLNAFPQLFGLPLDIPLVSLVLLIVGTIILIIFEGVMAPLEVFGLIGNIISYTRLAAICMAKGAVAAAFNFVIFSQIINQGTIVAYIIGALFLFLCHMLVIILGTLSAGIQAVRLNYVEFFLKFYKGGGEPFNPFGKVTKYTI